MKSFRRAVQNSFHHWPTLLLATACSFGIAALWGGNIGALYPVIETTLNGQSIQKGIADRIVQNQQRCEWLQVEIEQRRPLQGNAEIAADMDTDAIADPVAREAAWEYRQAIKQHQNLQWRLAWDRRLLDWTTRWLPGKPFQAICCIMAFLVFTTLLKHLLMLVNDLLIGYVTSTIVRSVRHQIYDRALAFDRSTFQQYGTSGLLASITHTSEALSLGLMSFFGAAIREPLRIAACLIGAGLICWRLLLLSMILAPLMLLVMRFFNNRIKRVAASILGRNASFHEVILESLSNIFTVQAYTMEAHERARFYQSTRDMKRCSLRMILYSGLSKPFSELIGVGMIAITVCAGSYLVVNQKTHIFWLRVCNEPLQIQDLMIFFGMLIGASDPLRKLGGVATSIYTGGIAAESLYGMLDRPVVLREPLQPRQIPTPHRELRLEKVVFHYDPANPVLRDVDLSIPFGQTVAILGGNGSGKSTLISLLGRFYDPVQGRLTLDAIDYRDLAISDIRRRIAVVSQNTELFNRSVMENICYGSPDATPQQAIQAAGRAHAHEFITQSLRDGYETQVGQGGHRLSGGQRQRIALARAILRNPEILILDESTSQIDMASELQIRQSLQEMKGKFTIIIIAHREALIALADQTYEVHQGLLRRVERHRYDAAKAG